MSDLICDREFGGVVIAGIERRIVVEWFKPLRDRGSWRCDWTIHRPDPNAVALNGHSYGVDSAQALLLAIGMVGGIIEHDYPKAFWLEAGEDLGLPGVSGR
ncbi:DUF6968 family protein [Brevundimonas sp.]|uniref:DUF6968 family protein n=1 Tax=Brevundimonas sp. TaxID=1871086 RepID=UPI003F704370